MVSDQVMELMKRFLLTRHQTGFVKVIEGLEAQLERTEGKRDELKSLVQQSQVICEQYQRDIVETKELQAQLEKAERVIRFYAEITSKQYQEDKEKIYHNKEKDADAFRYKSGKLAREYQAKKERG